MREGREGGSEEREGEKDKRKKEKRRGGGRGEHRSQVVYKSCKTNRNLKLVINFLEGGETSVLIVTQSTCSDQSHCTLALTMATGIHCLEDLTVV